MGEIEEEFSPERWTQKELIKHLYREVSSIHAKLDEMSSSITDKYIKLESDYRAEIKVIDNRIDQLEQFKASTKTMLGIISTVGVAILGGVISLIIKLFLA